MSPEQISGLIRHLAGFFGGYLVAKFRLPPEYFEAIIGGLAALGAVVWSITSKTPLTKEPPPAQGNK